MVMAVALLAACGGDGDSPRPTPTTAIDLSTPTAGSVERTPAPAPETLRVAFINLGSPITLDADDVSAEETFEARLQLLTSQVEGFEPDLVALTDATWTKDLGPAAWEALSGSLRLEPAYQRANPWFPDQDKDASDATRDLVGFEEGEALLSRYPVMQTRRLPLNPRTSETEGRIALHATLNIEPYGEVSVYVARLSGSVATREAQARDLRAQIDETREGRPVLVFADLGLAEDSEAVAEFQGGWYDLASAAPAGAELGTCCRGGMLFNVPEEPVGGEDGDDGTEASPQDGASQEGEEEDGTPTAPPEEEVATARTLYVFSSIWPAVEFEVFGGTPLVRADESRLYSSDHNGIMSVIELDTAEPGTGANE